MFVYGGETFDGRSKEPVSDIYLLNKTKGISWHQLGASNIGRAGHVTAVISGQIVIHGGVGKGNMVFGDTYKLTVK